MSFFGSQAKLSTIYPHPVMKSTPLFFRFDKVHVLIFLGQEDARKCLDVPKICHNRKHKLVFKVSHFVPFRNFMV